MPSILLRFNKQWQLCGSHHYYLYQHSVKSTNYNKEPEGIEYKYLLAVRY